MKSFLILFIPILMNTHIFDFSNDSDISSWQVVNDTVMGGRSDASFQLNDEGYGVFSGHVSLENNGGFSSLQYPFEAIAVNPNQKIRLRLKGDGKNYQFRVKNKTATAYSYIYEFETSAEWQTVDIILNQMSPQYRGQKLKRPNFDKDQIEQITFLIGNKKEQNFKLEIASIELIE